MRQWRFSFGPVSEELARAQKKKRGENEGRGGEVQGTKECEFAGRERRLYYFVVGGRE